MYYTQGKTQVYSPFGSFVVEQHDTGCLQRTSAGFRRRAPRGLTASRNSYPSHVTICPGV